MMAEQMVVSRDDDSQKKSKGFACYFFLSVSEKRLLYLH